MKSMFYDNLTKNGDFDSVQRKKNKKTQIYNQPGWSCREIMASILLAKQQGKSKLWYTL